MHRQFFLSIITLMLACHRAVARSYFVDGSCADRISQVAIPEAITLAQTARDMWLDDDFNKVLGYIFRGIDNPQKLILWSKFP